MTRLCMIHRPQSDAAPGTAGLSAHDGWLQSPAAHSRCEVGQGSSHSCQVCIILNAVVIITSRW